MTLLDPGITSIQASAGTGKTFAIAHLAMRLVAEEGLDIRRILLVTFTEAATAELSARVRTRLRDALEGLEARGRWRGPDDVLAEWVRARRGAGRARCIESLRTALVDYDEAPISTIHGFCAAALARHGLEARVRGSADLLGGPDELIAQAIDDFWAHLATSRPPGWFKGLDKRGLGRRQLRSLAQRALAPDVRLRPPGAEGTDDDRCREAAVEAARRHIQRRTTAEGTRTYDQQLTLLRDALVGDGGEHLAGVLRAAWDVVVVDEFQDTDPVQWAILRRIRPHRLVMVGDPKQAIYGFRNADVHTYLAAVDTADHTRQLPQCFRSDGALLAALAHLFGRLEDPFADDKIPWPPVREVHSGSRLTPPRPPLQLRLLPRDGRPLWSRRFLSPWDNDVDLAEIVAADVVRELSAGATVHGPGDPHSLCPGDCAVLTRTNAQAALVQRALMRRGVPAVLRVHESVLTTPVATDLVPVLAAFLDPSPKAVRLALGTRVLGRTGSDLLALEADERAWAETVSRFATWGQAWIEEGFFVAFRRLLDGDLDAAGDDPVTRLLRTPDGLRRVTDLMHVGEVLHQEATARNLGPEALLSWLRRRGPGADPERAARRMDTDSDAVHVVTVHSAKGLEYGVVFCPFSWGSTYLRVDERLAPLFHHQRLPVVDLDPTERERNIRIATAERLAEEIRLVYVALTRARYRAVLYHGLSGAQSAQGHLLHPSLDPWQASDADLLACLEELATHPGIALDTVDWDLDAEVEPWTAPPAEEEPEARALVRATPLDTWWRRSSYSGLVRSAVHGNLEAPEPDDDEPDEELAPESAVRGGEIEVPLADFPAGRRAGNFFHKVLELADFTDPGSLSAVVREQLTAHAFDADLWGATVSHGLTAVLSTEILDGLRLGDVPRSRRMDELEFTFPMHGGFGAPTGALSPESLARAFAVGTGPGCPGGYHHALRSLAFVPVRGFLHGFVDLVFEHQGRFYVVDYKSNRLGRTFADFQASRLPPAMARSHYVLQYHLYVVAVHRLLRWRLPDYDYERHLGGVLYLYLRGMVPERGPRFGVFHDRPPAALVERLERAMGIAP